MYVYVYIYIYECIEVHICLGLTMSGWGWKPLKAAGSEVNAAPFQTSPFAGSLLLCIFQPCGDKRGWFPISVKNPILLYIIYIHTIYIYIIFQLRQYVLFLTQTQPSSTYLKYPIWVLHTTPMNFMCLFHFSVHFWGIWIKCRNYSKLKDLILRATTVSTKYRCSPHPIQLAPVVAARILHWYQTDIRNIHDIDL